VRKERAQGCQPTTSISAEVLRAFAEHCTEFYAVINEGIILTCNLGTTAALLQTVQGKGK